MFFDFELFKFKSFLAELNHDIVVVKLHISYKSFKNKKKYRKDDHLRMYITFNLIVSF